ncbi:TorD/DmsD family molecular chaperone [Methylobacterium radiotolerans]|uniref:TorD/DmsD family molecular chaperone n=1 Tax=Methylobacterium radiotolerans TaxID=31998 RepID=UPI000734FB95|nr:MULTISPECIES: molecular chaperone TorD family protein [Methylobacterium]KTS08969.1 molecular chaperone TorD [Methylobacterium radiotolerans]KTS45070.1 molecular chaperone TorD [Methylobacterium radiotolerans]KZC00482.1 Chaperone protein TorD [Methylobacterium radiotolerans]MDE3747530.1 molecular chaperone TorD family protein [Methylobacterium radiotolerans]PVZ04711.1 TorA maturation chaperone TorD [Methylobacterium organophilum]
MESEALGGARVNDVDGLRARHYDLLAVLLGRPPGQDLLDTLAGLSGGGGILGQHVADLSRAAAETTGAEVEREFFALFIGVGRGELLPYASYYLTGFLNERPLALVREDLAALGLSRVEAMSEPEDHLAFLMDVMAGLAGGRFEAGPDVQARFFGRHLVPWADRFFEDLERAKNARFYRAVGSLGRTFMEVEAEAFAMDA